MIFVTVGSQKFQFNRLLEKIDYLISTQIINEPVFAQIGYSDYIPKNYRYEHFLNREQYTKAERDADIIITHGGTGAIIGALKAGKKVLAVPRLKKFGEHVDDHQLQLIQQFDDMGIIEACYHVEEIESSYKQLKCKTYIKYQSNTQAIIQNIDYYLKEHAENEHKRFD